MSLDEKNLFQIWPASSPLSKLSRSVDKKKTSIDKSLTFITLTPLITGFVRTLKSIYISQNDYFRMEENNEEGSMGNSIVNPSLVNSEFKLRKKNRKNVEKY